MFAPFIFTLDCPAFLSPFSTSKSHPCICGNILLTQILDPKAYHLGNCQRLLVRSKSPRIQLPCRLAPECQYLFQRNGHTYIPDTPCWQYYHTCPMLAFYANIHNVGSWSLRSLKSVLSNIHIYRKMYISMHLKCDLLSKPLDSNFAFCVTVCGPWFGPDLNMNKWFC